MSDVLFLYDNSKKFLNEIRVCDYFFDYGLQLIKSEKNVDKLFSAVEYLIRMILFKCNIF